MRLAFTYLLIIIGCTFSFSQGIDDIYVEVIPVSETAAESDINLSTYHYTFRVFIDLSNNYELIKLYGTELHPLSFKSTGTFYNSEARGVLKAEQLNEIPNVNDPIFYDSWITIRNACHGDNVSAIVPVYEDFSGAKDGFTPTEQSVTWSISSGLHLNMFEAVPRAEDFSSTNGEISCSGAQGEGYSNTICIGQFTTNGIFSCELNMQVRNKGTQQIGSWSAKLTVAPNRDNANIFLNDSQENLPPSVTISIPEENYSECTIGENVSIEVSAIDEDGVVSSVSLYANSSHIATDFDASDGFHFSFPTNRINEYVLTAVATDTNGARSISTPKILNVLNRNNTVTYEVESQLQNCFSSEYFCIPILADTTISGVTGFDVILKFDNELVAPTGFLSFSNSMVSNPSTVSYRANRVQDSLVIYTIYFNENAPRNPSFNGAGEVFCAEFMKNAKFGNNNSTEISIQSITESYPKYAIERPAKAGTYTATTNLFFGGSILFWKTQKAIEELKGTQNFTEISDLNSNTVTKTANDRFLHNAENSSIIKIERDISNTFDVQPYITGQDAFLTSQVLLLDTTYRPNIYEILAMDVNQDGTLSAGDLTQIQQRTAGKIEEYQQSTAAPSDWIFVNRDDILSNLSYRISSNYPISDEIGYYKLQVPLVEREKILPVEYNHECPFIRTQNYRAILLGDVTGNYGLKYNLDSLRQTDDYTKNITLEIGSPKEGISEMKFNLSSDEPIQSYDLSFKLKNSVKFEDVTERSYFNDFHCIIGDSLLKVTAFSTLDSLLTYKDNALSMQFTATHVLTNNDVEIVTCMINEKPANYLVQNNYLPYQDKGRETEIFPNPAQYHVYVKTDMQYPIISIYNMLGYLMDEKNTTSELTEFNVSTYPAGVYNVIVQSATDMYSGHFNVIREDDK